jgi:hypothetical protein
MIWQPRKSDQFLALPNTLERRKSGIRTATAVSRKEMRQPKIAFTPKHRIEELR